MSWEMSTQIRDRLLLALPLTFMAFSCTGSYSKIFGTVTYKGSPIPGGSIVFQAVDGKEYACVLDREGKYHLENVPTGVMKVYFNIPTTTFHGGGSNFWDREDAMKEDMKGPRGAPPEAQKSIGNAAANHLRIPEIPAKYRNADKSPLNFEVKTGSNTYDVELTD